MDPFTEPCKRDPNLENYPHLKRLRDRDPSELPAFALAVGKRRGASRLINLLSEFL